MYLNSKINTKEDFEKYSFLLEMNDNDFNNLDYVIEKFKDNEEEFYDFENKFKGYIEDFNTINLRNTNNKEEILSIEDLINKKLIKNIKYLNYLNYILGDNRIFQINTFKENLDNEKMLEKEVLEILKNNLNKDKIDNIIKKINEMEKSLFNKEDKIKRIIILERKIIDEMEIILNKLCFIFNVDYKNKDIKSKYIIITDLLKLKINSYQNLKDVLKNRINLLNSIDNLNLDLDIDDIKKISDDGIDFLLEKLRLYEMHKKDSRVNINFMVR